MIKGDKKNRRKLKIGIIENIFVGKDNTIISIRMPTEKSVTKRSIQLLCSVKLNCDARATTSNSQDEKALNINAEEFQSKRSAAAVISSSKELFVFCCILSLISIQVSRPVNARFSFSYF